MMTCTAKELCAATGGTLVQDGEGFSCVSTDSRRVEQGCLFIPLVGERFDGHTYLTQALESGAAGCLCSRLPEALVPGKFYVQVEDTLRALGQLAGWYREKFPIPVVQITGSAGKTTTKEMIASVLSQHFLTLKTEANYNNEIGTPQTLLRLMPEHQAAVIETGMDHFGQIRYLGEMVRPTVAVITNIGDAHIENLGNTRQGTLRAKSEIFEHLQPGGLAVAQRRRCPAGGAGAVPGAVWGGVSHHPHRGCHREPGPFRGGDHRPAPAVRRVGGDLYPLHSRAGGGEPDDAGHGPAHLFLPEPPWHPGGGHRPGAGRGAGPPAGGGALRRGGGSGRHHHPHRALGGGCPGPRGDAVCQGDVLISGVMDLDPIPPSTESLGTRIVHAEGKVLARTWRTLTAQIPLTATEKVYTGSAPPGTPCPSWANG